jgi:hypothetical protein
VHRVLSQLQVVIVNHVHQIPMHLVQVIRVVFVVHLELINQLLVNHLVLLVRLVHSHLMVQFVFHVQLVLGHQMEVHNVLLAQQVVK